MSGCELSSYSELAQVVKDLPVLVRSQRRARRMSFRQVAAVTGLSFSTIARVEQGEEVSSGTLTALLFWLGADVDD